MNPTDEWAWLARIRHPQGRKGECYAEVLTDFPEKFADRRHLWLLKEAAPAANAAAREVELLAHWPDSPDRARSARRG